ncbi:MAG: tetratricopeptide repeat protein [Acidobacteria bacterium]|nr:tetratricopeptide repeat protein [Acidobacteriota bacterium]
MRVCTSSWLLFATLGVIYGLVGCGTNRVPTFTEDVAPIIYSSCTPCHNEMEPQTFQLQRYEDVAKHAQEIADVTLSGSMPPWLPEPGSVAFVEDRSLSPTEIETIQKWVHGGAQRGEGEVMYEPPLHTSGPPDLEFEMAETYILPAEGRDVIRNFVIPLPVSEISWVSTVTFVPKNPKVVQHATIWIDRTKASQRLADEDPEPGFSGMDPRSNAMDPDGLFLGWTPGIKPKRFTEDSAWKLVPGTDMVIQLHLLPSGQPEPVGFKVQLKLTDHAPAVSPTILRMGTQSLTIPAEQRDVVVEDRFELPVHTRIAAFLPRARYLVKRIELNALTPNGAVIDLLHLDWNLNWQEPYTLVSPLPLEAGTVLTLKAIFDPSGRYTSNAHQPPIDVPLGPYASDEICDMRIQFLHERVSDQQILDRAATAKHTDTRIAGIYAQLERNPEDAQALLDLALALGTKGSLIEAMQLTEKARKIRPDWPAAIHNQGSILLTLGKIQEALPFFQATLKLDPNYYEAHFNIGSILLARGDLIEAEAAIQDGLKIYPGDPSAWNNAGYVAQARQDFDRAVHCFEQAIELNPTFPTPRMNLAMLWAGMGEWEDAASVLDDLISINPTLADAWYYRGMVAQNMDDLNSAERYWLQSITLQPDHQAAINALNKLNEEP